MTTAALSPVAVTDRANAAASALPPLLIEAQRIAATVIMGVHGRKRAGPGETFWQFRPYRFGDSTEHIDWHMSARTDRVFIRDNEWAAANTLWLWPSASSRMDYRSALAPTTKRERAVLLALALGSLALRAQERVTALGSPFAPAHARGALVRIAEWYAAQERHERLPEAGKLSRHAALVLLSDFLEPPADIASWLSAFAARGANGHLVQVVDPAEEALPWNGRVEFHEIAGPRRFLAGRTASIRAEYREKFAAQRAAVRDVARRIGWTFTVHRTDASPFAALLALHGLIGGLKSRVLKGA